MACAACHAKLDPPGFALESFDVIGGQRSRYRSIGAGDRAPRGSTTPSEVSAWIDPTKTSLEALIEALTQKNVPLP
ncbi:DUF1588 domain-containing protein [Gimesia alba]|uniref:DUF1588 domain-containing protein n=1 Tax=Gimesia alba TaxID=2527973 RepID=UPI001E600FDF|nr:DUF1588 domain-containing protein [Gimesia alba]